MRYIVYTTDLQLIIYRCLQRTGSRLSRLWESSNRIGLKRQDFIKLWPFVSLPDILSQLLNRRTPFGHEILASVKEFPQYTLAVKALAVHSNGGKDPVEVELSITCGLAVEQSNAVKGKKLKGRTQMTAILTLTSDLEMVDFRRIP